ncbi:unnamed protein product [Taenia asiatica]|uniref:HTH_48 domain-containing protein n=1 Tax=Taenia asiatica TaxID=60517 RepID=A0A0R3W0W1_TAEAS|nr:unnamed protein product [Taenia asiatica]
MDPRQYRNNCRSVLKPEYLSAAETMSRRVNTNTAPVYSDGYPVPMRSRHDRFASGQSYSVIRSHYTNNPTFMCHKRFQNEETRSKQPGHNQTEQLRRSREMDMFKDIGFNFDNDVLRAVRLMYSDKRSSGSQNNLRVTKKVNLSSTHSVVRVATRLSNRVLSLYERNLIKRILISMHEKVNEVTCRRLLSRLVKNYNGNEDESYAITGTRWVGSTVSGSRHFALPPENGPCPMGMIDRSFRQSLCLDTSPSSEPCVSPATPPVERCIDVHRDHLPPDDAPTSTTALVVHCDDGIDGSGGGGDGSGGGGGSDYVISVAWAFGGRPTTKTLTPLRRQKDQSLNPMCYVVTMYAHNETALGWPDHGMTTTPRHRRLSLERSADSDDLLPVEAPTCVNACEYYHKARKGIVVCESMDRLLAIVFNLKLIFNLMELDVKAVVMLENNMAYDAAMTHRGM